MHDPSELLKLFYDKNTSWILDTVISLRSIGKMCEKINLITVQISGKKLHSSIMRIKIAN